ncbi:hypothetical protein GCM10008941_22570 [Rhizomicrobium palustre]
MFQHMHTSNKIVRIILDGGNFRNQRAIYGRVKWGLRRVKDMEAAVSLVNDRRQKTPITASEI